MRTDGLSEVARLCRPSSPGLGILDALSMAPASEGRSHADLAAELGLRRSTLYRYLACLETEGLIEPAAENRYRLGPRIFALAASAGDDRSFAREAKTFVNALATISGETAHATIYDNGEVVTVEIADGEGPVGPRILLGSRRPAHCTASGKVFLAHLPEPTIESYAARGLTRCTERTIADRDSLTRALKRVQADGFAVEQGEYADGIACVAAPIFDARSYVAGALSISVVAKRLDRHRLVGSA